MGAGEWGRGSSRIRIHGRLWGAALRIGPSLPKQTPWSPPDVWRLDRLRCCRACSLLYDCHYWPVNPYPARPGAGKRSLVFAPGVGVTTSPWLRVPIAHQTCMLIVSLMNRTEPSQNVTFTPPAWLLLGVIRLLNPPGVPPSPSEV